MTDDVLIAQKPVRMAMWRVVRLQQMAERLHVHDDELIERALDLFFAAASLLESGTDEFPGDERPDRSADADILKQLREAAVSHERDWEPVPPSAERTFVPVEIEGKPLSETIIEERR